MQGLSASLFVGKPSEVEKYNATQHRPKHFWQSTLKIKRIILDYMDKIIGMKLIVFLFIGK